MIFLYEPAKKGLKITRVFGREGSVTLPNDIQGQPVTELGAYAFSDRMDEKERKLLLSRGKLCLEDGSGADCTDGLPDVEGKALFEVRLPHTLTRIGRYAFYNCGQLQMVEFGGAFNDLGAGALTGCHKIRRITVEVQENGASCLREILTELPEELQVELLRNEERGVFWFPEFFEEGVENTPARILENHVHGSGIRYRNCFAHKCLNVKEYDKLFIYAKAWEKEATVISLAADRILYPMELSKDAREQYVNYLKEHLPTAFSLLSEQERYGDMGKILGEILPCRDVIEELLDRAEGKGDTECVSILMDYLHQHTRKQRKVFEL